MKNSIYILLLVLFSLFLEFTVRGTYALTRDAQYWVFLTIFYFVYYKILEDLIVRYKLKDYQLLYLVVFLSIIIETLITGSALKEQVFLNFSPIALLIPTVLWLSLQGYVALYFVNRIKPRKMEFSKMGKLGWAIIILALVGIAAGATFERAQIVKPGGYLILGILAGIFLFLFRRSIKKRVQPEIVPFQKSRLMDLLAAGYFLAGLIAFIFLSEKYGQFSEATLQNGYMNNPSYLMIGYSVLAGVVLMIYRWRSKKSLVV